MNNVWSILGACLDEYVTDDWVLLMTRLFIYYKIDFLEWWQVYFTLDIQMFVFDSNNSYTEIKILL